MGQETSDTANKLPGQDAARRAKGNPALPLL